MTHTGFFERYFITPFFRKYSDFSGSTDKREAWVSFGAWLIVTAGIVGALLGQVGLMGPEIGFGALAIIGGVWVVCSICPLAALLSRAFHGKEEEDAKPQIRFLGIDILLIAVCGLFLLLGILMTITTLNSGELNMNPRGSGEKEENPILMQDSIWEEPIFTYQDDKPAIDEVDTMSDLTDADTVALDESFDPEISTEVPIEIDTLSLQ